MAEAQGKSTANAPKIVSTIRLSDGRGVFPRGQEARLAEVATAAELKSLKARKLIIGTWGVKAKEAAEKKVEPEKGATTPPAATGTPPVAPATPPAATGTTDNPGQ